MKDKKIDSMFITNKTIAKEYKNLYCLRKGLLGDIMFLQKLYASQELLDFRGEDEIFSFGEFFALPIEEQAHQVRWYHKEFGHSGDVGYARNDNGRHLDRVPRIRNAQLLKLSRRDSILNREYKKLCSRKLMGTNIPGVKISFWDAPSMGLPELKITGRLSKDMIPRLPHSLAVFAAKARAERNWPTGASLPDGSFCKWTKDFNILVHFTNENLNEVIGIYHV